MLQIYFFGYSVYILCYYWSILNSGFKIDLTKLETYIIYLILQYDESVVFDALKIYNVLITAIKLNC